jgi:hypothetical protein
MLGGGGFCFPVLGGAAGGAGAGAGWEDDLGRVMGGWRGEGMGRVMGGWWRGEGVAKKV